MFLFCHLCLASCDLILDYPQQLESEDSFEVYPLVSSLENFHFKSKARFYLDKTLQELFIPSKLIS